jgi:ElaB/YqjD/DUF883 family membrane-anchored ribosome-binding protein
MLSDRPLQRHRIQWSASIRDHPLAALALGATAGFAAGGGMRTRVGAAMLTLAARTAAREVIMSFIAEQRRTMSVQEEIPRINNELEQARHDLNETLTRINQKVERTEEEFSPNHIVKQRPLMASCCAAAMGFVIGARAERSLATGLLLGVLLGYVLASASTDTPGS